eukprot:TRINITY_DN5940_c0_g1_i2.p1 TRINITY_DN5940_c0_g1~~TRINITY_DN5940_c0_g1_i2.p1  ORF type:complete len:228 (-),score=39.79 TRINITY_DN5940_c0_g1_i2:114-797(-)
MLRIGRRLAIFSAHLDLPFAVQKEGIQTLCQSNSIFRDVSSCYRNYPVLSILQKRSLSTSPCVFSQKDVGSEDVVIFIDSKDKEVSMKYKDLVEKAKGRNIVKLIRPRGRKDMAQRFKILSDEDLEVALRKQRSETNYLGKKDIIETEEGRIKMKMIDISEKISDDSLQTSVGKIRKWLIKGNYVKVNVKSKDKKSQEYVALKEKILDHFKEDQELLGHNHAKLTIK